MPYIEGESLRDKLAKEGELPIAEAVRILRDVVDALSHAQSVPPALEQLVLKCLEKKAADRWQTAEELLPQQEALATRSGGE